MAEGQGWIDSPPSLPETGGSVPQESVPAEVIQKGLDRRCETGRCNLDTCNHQPFRRRLKQLIDQRLAKDAENGFEDYTEHEICACTPAKWRKLVWLLPTLVTVLTLALIILSILAVAKEAAIFTRVMIAAVSIIIYGSACMAIVKSIRKKLWYRGARSGTKAGKGTVLSTTVIGYPGQYYGVLLSSEGNILAHATCGRHDLMTEVDPLGLRPNDRATLLSELRRSVQD